MPTERESEKMHMHTQSLSNILRLNNCGWRLAHKSHRHRPSSQSTFFFYFVVSIFLQKAVAVPHTLPLSTAANRAWLAPGFKNTRQHARRSPHRRCPEQQRHRQAAGGVPVSKKTKHGIIILFFFRSSARGKLGSTVFIFPRMTPMERLSGMHRWC